MAEGYEDDFLTAKFQTPTGFPLSIWRMLSCRLAGAGWFVCGSGAKNWLAGMVRYVVLVSSGSIGWPSTKMTQPWSARLRVDSDADRVLQTGGDGLRGGLLHTAGKAEAAICLPSRS